MIVDRIENAELYTALSPRIAMALRALRDTDLATREVGRYELDGDRVFALIHRYETKPVEKGIWEAHRKYIDVQYVARGDEQKGVDAAGERLGRGSVFGVNPAPVVRTEDHARAIGPDYRARARRPGLPGSLVRPAINTARTPVRKMPSNVPAPPIEAIGAPSPCSLPDSTRRRPPECQCCHRYKPMLRHICATAPMR